jgi:hypothetical protein
MMNNKDRINNKVGFYSAIVMTLLTLITFILAMTAIPISGANCPANCVDYPYLDTLAQYPKDFYWMFTAMFWILAVIVFEISLHYQSPKYLRIISHIALVLSISAAIILLIDYYMQASIIPMSLINNESEGIPLLIQYNPHGIFLILEELGYLLINLSFLFTAFTFPNKTRLQKTIRTIFFIAAGLGFISVMTIFILQGLERLDRLEVLLISIDWLALIVNGVLLSLYFRKRLTVID